MQIAIDGPAGAGKSTIAKELAQKLGFVYIDTGALYRSLTWQAIQKGISPADIVSLEKLANNNNIYFKQENGTQRVICNGKDITEDIRHPEVTALVSQISAHTRIREIMVKKQQEMADALDVVMDGRDIGECVLPKADYKFFLTANLEERLKRRLKELQSKGFQINEAELKQEIINRDAIDSSREFGSLKMLEDSIVIDSSNFSIAELLNKILSFIREDKNAI